MTVLIVGELIVLKKERVMSEKEMYGHLLSIRHCNYIIRTIAYDNFPGYMLFVMSWFTSLNHPISFWKSSFISAIYVIILNSEWRASNLVCFKSIIFCYYSTLFESVDYLLWHYWLGNPQYQFYDHASRINNGNLDECIWEQELWKSLAYVKISSYGILKL